MVLVFQNSTSLIVKLIALTTFGNDALQLDRLVNERGVKTMFDRLDYLKTLNCNAQYDWNAHTTYDGLVNLGAGEALRDFGESVVCENKMKGRRWNANLPH